MGWLELLSRLTPSARLSSRCGAHRVADFVMSLSGVEPAVVLIRVTSPPWKTEAGSSFVRAPNEYSRGL